MSELSKETMIKALMQYAQKANYDEKQMKRISGVIEGIEQGLFLFDPLTEQVALTEWTETELENTVSDI